MLEQLLIGSFMITLSILIMATDVALAVVALSRLGPWILSGARYFRLTTILAAATLWLLAAVSVTVWIWAGLFMWLGIFDGLEPALYFSIVALTTLGFGDIVLPQDWRLLSGFVAANGLVLFGLNTAFLIEVVVQLNRAYDRSVTNAQSAISRPSNR